jgi:hypothetical protein
MGKGKDRRQLIFYKYKTTIVQDVKELFSNYDPTTNNLLKKPPTEFKKKTMPA